MQNLEKSIQYYLKKSTNHAILITGEWGAGKTHYFNTIIKNLVLKTPVLKDNRKKYQPVFISLFGLKSIEDIQTAIFLDLYIKDPTLRIAGSIAKAFAKGVLQVKGLGGFNNYLEEIKLNKGTFLKAEEIVLFFDDLERINKNLPLDELIGYINSLVDTANVKVIVIANEKKIKADAFIVLKEKTIGNTIEFIPNISETIDSIIDERFVDPSYNKFLKEKKQIILKKFASQSSNFRILIFALNYFQDVFSIISTEILPKDKLKGNLSEILESTLVFTFAIALEYKNGKISFKNKEGVDTDYDELAVFRRAVGKSLKTETKGLTYAEEFADKYYNGGGYYFYETIYNYITGGQGIEKKELIDEIRAKFHIVKGQILPQYEILGQLNAPLCYKLKNKRYLSLTSKLVEYAKNGKIDLKDYLTIFYYATRYNNPLAYKLEQLEKQLILGIKKGKKEYSYEYNLDRYLDLPDNTEHLEFMKRIKEQMLNMNNILLLEKTKKETIELEVLCYSDFNAFFDKITDEKSSQRLKPFFNAFKPIKFFSFFKKTSPDNRWQIVRLFSIRYHIHNGHYLNLENIFLTELLKLIDKNIKSDKGLEMYIYSEFKKAIQGALNSNIA